MKQSNNGSVYVAVVFAALAAYFAYQTWFNPNRAVKGRLGDLAAALSAPAAESDVERLGRAGRVRRFFAPDAELVLGEGHPDIDTPEHLSAALAAWRPPPGGVDVAFVDVQVNVESRAAARAYLTVEIARVDQPGAQPTYERHEAKVTLANRDGTWLITRAEPNVLQPQP